MMQIVGQGPLSNRLYKKAARLASKPSFLFACLILLTLVGTLLRLYKLGQWSFWGDEMFTVTGREDGFNYSPIRQSLSLALIQAVIRMNGLNEGNARIIPALIGAVSIPVLFLITRRLFDVPTALLASLLLAISPWHLYWSQSARFYTTLLLFYSLALFYFYLGMEQDRPWYLVLCLVFLGLAVKERLLALFFLPIVLVYLLGLWLFAFEKPRGWNYRNLLLFVVPGMLGGFLFASPYLLNLSGWLSGFGFVNNSPFWLAGGFAYYVGLPIICMGGVGSVYLVAQKDRLGLLLGVSALLPILALSAIAPFHYTANRYAFISLTSWIMLASVSGVLLMKKSTEYARWLTLGVWLVLLVQPISEDALYFVFQNGNRDNWKAAFAYIDQHRQAEELVVSGDTYVAEYYLSTGTIYAGDVDLEEIVANGERVWFVEDMAGIQKFPEFHAWLAENTHLVSVQDVAFQARNFSMRVYLYDPALMQKEGGLENDS